MKQYEIDRPAHMNNQATMPAVNWTLIASLLIVAGTLVFAFFKLAGVL